jgi:excisionase family DNA binding protein
VSGYLRSEQAAELLSCSVDTVLRKVERNQIPHRKIGGVRRVLFVEDELRAWIDGAPLEVVQTANGGRVVRPVENGTDGR